MSKWMVTKMEAPVCLKFAMQKPRSIDIELQKCKISQAIYEAHSYSTAAGNIQLWKRPDMLRTGPSTIPQGELILVPHACMNGIVMKESLNSVSIGSFPIGEKHH